MSVECKLDLDVEEYVSSFRPDMMRLVSRAAAAAAAEELQSGETDAHGPASRAQSANARVSPPTPGQVLAWVNGAKFVDICTMTKQFEGSIIRVIRRLEELCRQLADAAKAVGDEALERKFKDASARMRRDIIFAGEEAGGAGGGGSRVRLLAHLPYPCSLAVPVSRELRRRVLLNT